MKEFFKKIKYLNLLFIIAYIVLGSFLIAGSYDITRLTITYIFAGMLVGSCIIRLIDYFIYRFELMGLIYGLLCGIMGLIFFIIAPSVANNFLEYAFAIFFIIKGLFAIEDSYDYRLAGDKIWYVDTTFGLILIGWGIALFILKSLTFVGWALETTALLHIISIIIVASTVRSRVLPRHKGKLEGKETIVVTDDRKR